MDTLSNHSRRDLTPGVSRKRQKVEDLDACSPSPAKTTTATSHEASEPAESASSNQLIAGHLAHEFLTRGTLLGERWDQARAEGGLVSDSDAGLKKVKPSLSQQAEPVMEKRERYAEVENLLKTDGAQLLGIVNPTQLAMWLPK
ncbi:hypothetical protein L1049_004594 [Liquidambar formosana]|uniref:Uncharacterized protein n=1 Tax=Liquidambar formosana TaxID=63359 RepID=A0AAP0RTN0_LIQFO